MENTSLRGITLLGLGPGEVNLLTRDAWEWLEGIPEIYLRTKYHPTVARLPRDLLIHSFDDLYDRAETFEAVYEEIITTIIQLGQQPAGVTYAVPGHPFVAEATCPEIARRAKKLNIPIHLIDGLSFIEVTCSALGIDPYPKLILMDALELGTLHYPSYSTDSPALIAQIYSRQVASEVKLTLGAVLPDEYRVKLVHSAGTERQLVEDLALYEIDRSPHVGLLTSLYVPPLNKETTFEYFQEIIARLRAPDGCPWDRKQTHLSLRPYLLEETYETLSALDAEDPEAMSEEFGDLLLQIVLHTQIASEDGEFSMTDVLEKITTKLVRRHPHVFGQVEVDGVSEVLSNWEKIKAEERKENGGDSKKGILDGVAKALPALSQAQEYQSRAARVGFDWGDIQPVLDKVVEELHEVQNAPSQEDREKELGDLLFALVNVIRWYKVDAESALRGTNQKFYRRFSYIEKKAESLGKHMEDMTLQEMDVFWEDAKKEEGENFD